jgi:hypothetical protein
MMNMLKRLLAMFAPGCTFTPAMQQMKLTRLVEKFDVVEDVLWSKRINGK